MSNAQPPVVVIDAAICGNHHSDECRGCVGSRELNDSLLASEREAIGELVEALETIHEACDAEIKACFRTSSHKSEEQLGRNSAIYSLLVVPRNIARAALAKTEGGTS